MLMGEGTLRNESEAALAEAAGVRSTRVDRYGSVIAGDVILAVDGRPVGSVEDLLSQLDEYRIGDRILLSVWRAGREMQIEAVLGSGG